jgi:hypothetical protein
MAKAIDDGLEKIRHQQARDGRRKPEDRKPEARKPEPKERSRRRIPRPSRHKSR